MRTNAQGVKRYFLAVWVVFASVCVLTTVASASVNESTLDAGLAVGSALLAGVGAVIGFVHGVTALHAKQLDAQDAEQSDAEE